MCWVYLVLVSYLELEIEMYVLLRYYGKIERFCIRGGLGIDSDGQRWRSTLKEIASRACDVILLTGNDLLLPLLPFPYTWSLLINGHFT